MVKERKPTLCKHTRCNARATQNMNSRRCRYSPLVCRLYFGTVRVDR
ncbi:hypothetical protein E2C01_037029 [Portunus trituberculatus]|uniref:Uncharacterized protein n=1 Tax=Portunus trituberculatus TaxID=210409 RepID=A0A5B7FFZ1_PORTR|nr:hypothetical protein [Portunus trituberculatus]